MRLPILLASLLALSASAAHAEAPDPNALVDAEHAFCRDVAATSVRDGFLKWLAPTAIVFAPGPVSGVKLYGASAADSTRLVWEPVTGAMSAGGDMGWTSGPWEFRADGSHSAPDVTGTYVTVWKRQADGTLKAVVDGGVSHAAVPLHAEVPQVRALPPAPPVRQPLGQRRDLWKADAAFARVAAAEGYAAALAQVAAPDVRALRKRALPVTGRDAARDSTAAHHGRATLMSQAQFIAESGDLGYTYGSCVEGTGAAADSLVYLHVWHRDGRTWQLALDLLLPLPKTAH